MTPVLELPDGYHEIPPGKLVNVATCLEMRGPPQRALMSFPSELTLKRFDPTDLAGFRKVFAAVGADLMWFSRHVMADEKLAGILANPAIESFAFRRGDQLLGILELNFDDMPNCELAFFGLVPDAIGGGVGRALMDESIRRAWSKPTSRYWVHTCTYDSPLALPFYIRSGFTPYTRMIELHDDPRLQGKLPVTASPQIPMLP